MQRGGGYLQVAPGFEAFQARVPSRLYDRLARGKIKKKKKKKDGKEDLWRIFIIPRHYSFDAPLCRGGNRCTLCSLSRLAPLFFPPVFRIARSSSLYLLFTGIQEKQIKKMKWNFCSTYTMIESRKKNQRLGRRVGQKFRERIAWIVPKQIHCNPHRWFLSWLMEKCERQKNRVSRSQRNNSWIRPGTRGLAQRAALPRFIPMLVNSQTFPWNESPPPLVESKTTAIIGWTAGKIFPFRHLWLPRVEIRSIVLSFSAIVYFLYARRDAPALCLPIATVFHYLVFYWCFYTDHHSLIPSFLCHTFDAQLTTVSFTFEWRRNFVSLNELFPIFRRFYNFIAKIVKSCYQKSFKNFPPI